MLLIDDSGSMEYVPSSDRRPYSSYYYGYGAREISRLDITKNVLNKVLDKYQDRFNWSLQTLHNNGRTDTQDFSSSWRTIKNKVRLPKYLHKTQGRFVVEFNNQMISKKRDENGYLIVSPRDLKLVIPTRREEVKQVRIVPQLNYYVIEVVYEVQEEEMRTGVVVGAIDLGLNNIATIVTNDKKNPLILSGRKLKSINQYFNKNIADRKAKLPKEVHTSKEIERLWTKRRNKIDYETHKLSKYIVELMDKREVSKLIIGNNGGWKQGINLGKRNNQNFVNIPYKKIIDQIIYKCQMKGIEVIVREESYTSKASFLDYDYIPTINKDDEVKDFSGKRVKRGLYRTNKGKRINADVNGAYNIMAKESLNYIKTKREELSFSPKLVKL